MYKNRFIFSVLLLIYSLHHAYRMAGYILPTTKKMKPTTKKTKRKWWGALSKIQAPRERCLFDSLTMCMKRNLYFLYCRSYIRFITHIQIGWAYFTDDEEDENKVVAASSSVRRGDRERLPPRSFHNDDESKVSVCAFYLIPSF